jgi:formate/nitrite transporter
MSNSNNFNTPAEVVELQIASGAAKTTMPLLKMVILAILAGVFVAFGAEASTLAMHTISDVGVARLVAGCIFPAGLIMIIIVGGELFTGNCLIVEAICAGKASAGGWVKNLLVVFFANLIGSLIVVAIVYFANQLNYTSGALGAKTIQIALGKTALPFATALVSGIGCNILVCVAVLAAMAARDVAGKIVAIFFPIMAFVASGFEHCVANMYYIPAGIAAAQNPTYAVKAMELYGVTQAQLDSLNLMACIGNILPVTIGNIIGGVLIGLACYVAFAKKE